MTVTSIAAQAPSETKIVDAIAAASRNSGVGFNYLLATAKRESGLNSTAKSTTSSATGLYQFVAQTWLGTLKAHGAAYGLSNYADVITRGTNGQYTVADPALKQEILALRSDPVIAAQMAASLSQDNAKVLESKLNRPPTEGELYAAHVLGASGAAKLILAAAADPTGRADFEFPAAAVANRGLFYDSATGQPVTLAALQTRLTGSQAAPTAMLASASVIKPFYDLPAYRVKAGALNFGSQALAVLNAIQPADDSDNKDKERKAAAST